MNKVDIQGMSETELMDILLLAQAELVHRAKPLGFEEACNVCFISLVMKKMPHGDDGLCTPVTILQALPVDKDFEDYTKEVFRRSFEHMTACLHEAIVEGRPFAEYLNSLGHSACPID